MTDLRPNRFQSHLVASILANALGPDVAEQVLAGAGAADLPALSPSAPRDLDALAGELRPFSSLYRALEERLPKAEALALVRLAILRSSSAAHLAMAEAQIAAADEIAAPARGPSDAAFDEPPLNVVSPPAPSFQMPLEKQAAPFDRAMAYSACRGTLFRYDSEEVRFHVTDCHWCRAMEREGTPELIEFFCETDARFMDDHPTHRLRLSSTIGRGGAVCDFRFVRRDGAQEER
ncbi:MAG: hypothetical protein FJX78_08620 [Armatimonadetes bacterium]|nr:hypothetical protein [Armatimonadota bacterium]